MKINILTTNCCQNALAFNFPLFLSREIFNRNGYNFNFIYSYSDNIYCCDIVFINSKFFLQYKDALKKSLEKFNNKGIKIIWFDTADSCWSQDLDVLPYVSKFLKSQLYKDKSLYLKCFKTGRMFTDVLSGFYKCNDSEPEHVVAKVEDLHKMDISWNTCFENYIGNRFTLQTRIFYKFYKKLPEFLRKHHPNFSTQNNIKFTPINKNRELDISYRVALSYSRESIAAHRASISDKLSLITDLSDKKVSLEKYFKELNNSKISIGPFGYGEITLRDFETIICGSMLMKPSMDKFQTWPNFFEDGEIYVAFKWNLSDLLDKINEYLENPSEIARIANNAQKLYKYHLSDDGMQEFYQRLKIYIDETIN